jgi:serine/threonine-protein kinase HipA
MEVADYFRIRPARAKSIQQEVRHSVSHWADKAKLLGISRAEQERMAQAFRF